MSGKTNGKRAKLVRDSYTIPKAEFSTIDSLKLRAITLGTAIKKSELLRAGLMVLAGLSDAALKAAIAAVPTLKTGRPSAPKATLQAPKAATKVAAVPGPAKPSPKAAAPKTVANPVTKTASARKVTTATKAALPAKALSAARTRTARAAAAKPATAQAAPKPQAAPAKTAAAAN